MTLLRRYDCQMGKVKKCRSCKRTLEGTQNRDRKWCSALCRGEKRREAARRTIRQWQDAAIPIEGCEDLENWLLDHAPEDCHQYRLSCPGSPGNGGRSYFPKGAAWRLRPFQRPSLPRAGVYRVTWYGPIGELIGDGGEIAIGEPSYFGKAPGDAKKRFSIEP